MHHFQWLTSKHKRALVEALEKIKSGTPSCGHLVFFSFGIKAIYVCSKPNNLFVLFGFFEELMLLGFISLLLTVLQDHISDICIPKSIGDSWLPCSKEAKSKSESENKGRKLLGFSDPDFSYRRRLAVKGNDYCSKEVGSKGFCFHSDI